MVSQLCLLNQSQEERIVWLLDHPGENTAMAAELAKREAVL